MRRRDFFKALGVAAVAPAAFVAAPQTEAARIIAIDHDAGSLTMSGDAWRSSFAEGDYLFLQGDFGTTVAGSQGSGLSAWLPWNA